MQSFEGRTGKKRLGAALVGSFAALMALMMLILSGGIAIADISTGFGLPFQATIQHLNGQGLEQYGWFLGNSLHGATDAQKYPNENPTDAALPNQNNAKVQTTVETYLPNATLTGLQQTFCVPMPDLLGAALHALGYTGTHAGFEVQVNAPKVFATGLLADVAGQNSVTLGGVQANVPMGTTLGNGATGTDGNGALTIQTPPQDPGLAGMPITYANTVTGATKDDNGNTIGDQPVTQYISYQYASSLTLRNPTFHTALGTFEGNFDNHACDWQAHNMGLPGF